MHSQIIKEGFLNLETVPEAKTLTNRGTFHKRLTLMILHTVKKRCLSNWASPVATALGTASREELVALDGISRSVSRFCNSKNELKSGFPAVAEKMGPFSEPSVIVPILEGSRNGPGFRAHFGPAFHPS